MFINCIFKFSIIAELIISILFLAVGYLLVNYSIQIEILVKTGLFLGLIAVGVYFLITAVISMFIFFRKENLIVKTKK